MIVPSARKSVIAGIFHLNPPWIETLVEGGFSLRAMSLILDKLFILLNESGKGRGAMLGRVLVLSASAGAGHLRAAEAIEKAIRIRGLASEVQHLDVLKYTNKVFRHLYSKAYIDLVNSAPELLGWLYDHLDDPAKNDPIRLAFDRLNANPFIHYLQRYQPDVAICTHFLPAEIISSLKGEEKVKVLNTVVVTDFDVHAMWLCRHVEQYFVALEETKVHLRALGVPDSLVTITGIPIDPVFVESKDKRGQRRRHGLEPDRFTILVSAGGFGVGPVGHLMQALAQLSHPAQVVAVCGRNEALKAELAETVRRLAKRSVVSFTLLGFTTEMDELMTAADLFVGKPGGLTTSEALAKGLPMVVINPIPGQEERNSDHLLEQGAAIRCNNLPALAYKIDALIDTPGKLTQMEENARAMGKPEAAFAVVDRLAALCQPRVSSSGSSARHATAHGR
jgi:processive 1,2-diacylglycerol beta-glucosyltransferase